MARGASVAGSAGRTPEHGCGWNPCAVVDPRGAVMAASRGDGTVALVDLRTKRPIAVLPARNGNVAEPMAFTSDGRRLVTGGIAGTVTIWDVRSRAVVRRLRFSGPVAAVAVSPDGRLLAVQQEAGKRRELRVEVRDLRSGSTVADAPAPLRRGPVGVGELAFTADGRVLVASDCCGGGSRAVGWDARSGAQLFERPRHRRFALSPDSRVIAAGTDDGHVIFFGRPHRQASRRGDQGGGCDDRPARHLARRTAARRRRARRRPRRCGTSARARASATRSRSRRAWSPRWRSSPAAGC